MSVTLFLGRHGETRLNSEDKLRGWLDVPLNSDGVKEAEAMGVAMSKTRIVRIYCSDLDRADHTAKVVATHHKLKTIPRQWFRPLNYGQMQGKSLADIQPELDRLNEQWKSEPDYQVPGGESWNEFQRRNLSGMHAILNSAEDDEQIMLVAHLRNCLLFHAVAVTGGPLEGAALDWMNGASWHQQSGSVSHFEWDHGQQALRYAGMFFDPPEEHDEKAQAS